jgi:hypothetical protein
MGLGRKTVSAKRVALNRDSTGISKIDKVKVKEEEEDVRDIRKEKTRKRMSNFRKNETVKQYKKRLENLKKYQNIFTNAQSPEQREKRLTSLKENQITRINAESPEERNKRLKILKTNQTIRVNKESPEDRDKRLGTVKKNQKTRLSLESAEDRDKRLIIIKNNDTSRRSMEPAHVRNIRLQNMSQRKVDRIISESPEERSQRTEQMRLNRKRRLENEPLSTKIRRLDYQVNYQQSRHESTSFEDSINVFPILICVICTKRCYSHQGKTLKKEKISTNLRGILQIVDLPDTFTACQRCAMHLIQYGKIPSQAKWNNLTPCQQPIEIQNLSKVERRLLARINPFIKIIKYSGRFGQYGVKGRATLFAQDVTEISEQLLDTLPHNLSNIGLVLVTESLENINKQRDFQIDASKVKSALQWLVKNNSLYHDVAVNENFSQGEI